MAFIPVSKLAKAYTSLKGRVERVKEKSELAIGEVIKVGTVAGVAFGCGYANERYGIQVVKEGGPIREYQVAGMPGDLAVGVGITVLALAGAAGKYQEHGSNVGLGFLACYGTRLGQQKGATARITSQQPKQVAAGGVWQGWNASQWAQGQPAARAQG